MRTLAKALPFCLFFLLFYYVPAFPSVLNTTTGGNECSYSLQVCSRQTLAKAKKDIAILKAQAIDAYWKRVDLSEKGIWYRVLVGCFRNNAEASLFLKTHHISERYSGIFIRRNTSSSISFRKYFYSIQVCSRKTLKEAKEERLGLIKAGYDNTFWRKAVIKKKEIWFRVFIERFATHRDALLCLEENPAIHLHFSDAFVMRLITTTEADRLVRKNSECGGLKPMAPAQERQTREIEEKLPIEEDVAASTSKEESEVVATSESKEETKEVAISKGKSGVESSFLIDVDKPFEPEDKKRWLSFGFGAGATYFGKDIQYSNTNPTSVFEYDVSYYPVVQVDYWLTNRLALELMGRYERYKWDEVNSLSTKDSKINSYTLIFGPVFYFGNNNYTKKGFFFGQLGVGYRDLDMELDLPVIEYESAVGGELAFGYEIKGLSLRLGYSYFEHDAKRQPGISTDNLNKKLDLSGGFFDVTYNFGR